METMRLTEKKKSSKGIVVGLLMFFIIGGAILFFAMKMEDEPAVTVGTNIENVETQNLVKVEDTDKEELKEKNKKIEFSVEDKVINDQTNKKMKANMTLPVISIEKENVNSVNEDVNKYYTGMYDSLKEQMASANSNYTYKVTYNVYENMVEEKKIISLTIYERIVDDSAKKNTMNKIKTYNINAATKELITQSNDIAQTFLGKEYKTIIRDSIRNYVVSNQMIEETKFNYTYTGLEHFYIKNDEFHLVFNEGDIVNSKYGVLDIIVNK